MKKITLTFITLALFAISCNPTRNHSQTANNEIESRTFDQIRPFRDGLAAVQIDGKWGFIDRDSNIVIPPQFYWANGFSGNFAQVGFERRGEVHFIDRVGTIISRDSVEAFYRREFFERFYAYPLISAEEVARIAPLIRSWTEFYGIDLSQARLVGTITEHCINCPEEEYENRLDFFNFRDDDDGKLPNDKTIVVSPNRRLYLQFIPLQFDERDNVYRVEWCTSQDVWLSDLNQRHAHRVRFNGSSSLTEAAFWESNDVFILVGNTRDWQTWDYLYTISIYDMGNNTIVSYQIIAREEDVWGYVNASLKRRGIVVRDY